VIERKKAPPADGSRNVPGAVKKKAPLPKRGAEDHRLAVPSETTLPREKEVARQSEWADAAQYLAVCLPRPRFPWRDQAIEALLRPSAAAAVVCCLHKLLNA
jgi:hypothetical protein